MTKINNSINATDDGIRIGDYTSSFSQTGPIGDILYAKDMNPDATSILSMQNFRLAKFMKETSSIAFEDLQEVPQDDGDTWYTAESVIDGEVFSFHISRYEIIKSIKLTPVNNEQEIEQRAKKYKIDQENTYIVIDGKKYFVDTSIPLNYGIAGGDAAFKLKAEAMVSALAPIVSLIAQLVKKFGFEAISKYIGRISSGLLETLWGLLKNTVRVAYRFIFSFFSRVCSGAEVAEAYAEAMEDASAGEILSGLELSTFLIGVVGAIFLIAILLIIIFALHTSYQIITIYNLTDCDLHFRFPYIYEGEMPREPSSLIPAQSKTKNLGNWYHATGFMWKSSNVFTGIGYAIGLNIVNPEKTSSRNYAAMFDIPWTGENSLFASITEPSNYKNFYKENEGVHKERMLSVSDDKYELIVTYDYLQGEHPNPDTGENVYLYNTMVIVRDKV
ncbi:hypothetical protein KQ944_13350 [Bacillus subtilis]|uniref:hypothetical protein n=1 Tax=Pseudochrobactrum asaccharolyticum TaxID=354351 RepID=UPI001F28C826|nr:hypothetical protein [Pseudochrobactrum asaccharolyticum]MCF7646792.1 hypothetical protein [Pseudochrobactrum asaccharolyticum]MCF7672617.1 hypothetical protein [Bacillus subtilis]